MFKRVSCSRVFSSSLTLLYPLWKTRRHIFRQSGASYVTNLFPFSGTSITDGSQATGINWPPHSKDNKVMDFRKPVITYNSSKGAENYCTHGSSFRTNPTAPDSIDLQNGSIVSSPILESTVFHSLRCDRAGQHTVRCFSSLGGSIRDITAVSTRSCTESSTITGVPHAAPSSNGDPGASGDSVIQDLRARSHPEVKVVKKTDKQLLQEIQKLIHTHTVVLFMKGTPEAPQCGFSRRAVEMLLDAGCDDFTFVDVLRSERVRELLKKTTNWPTIPQLFIRGEFVGGCDLMTELFESGKLQRLLHGDQPSDSATTTASGTAPTALSGENSPSSEPEQVGSRRDEL